jgi:EmrB/QacA subfamily drug resistance transporter
MTVVPMRTTSRNLILVAMILAVSMTFIDQTIVSIAAPQMQRSLGLTNTGLQWVVNAYLLSLAALFALGGRLADTVGHGRMVTLGVAVFATASALCGLAPSGAAAEPWLVAFRAVQGAGAALMFPAALAIVVQAFDLQSRGRALALFFGISAAFTAVGPVVGGYLLEWSWRAIFWINIPIALLALATIARAKPQTSYRAEPMDYPGLLLISAGVAVSVFGFQQASSWGWGNPVIGGCIGAGALLLLAFFRVEQRRPNPLIPVGVFRNRAFAVESLVLGIASLVFVPVFFFASEYAQIALGESAQHAGLYLLYFFAGFVVASQIGGRMLDRRGAKRSVVLGCAFSAAGFALWAGKVTDLSFSAQKWYVVLAGAGMGLMLGPSSTDAVNRASQFTYGEATGITQTVRNYAASVGLATLGTVLVTRFRTHVTASLIAAGEAPARAASQAARIAQAQNGGGAATTIPHFVRLDFAAASQTVFYVMAAIMAAGALTALRGLTRGRQVEAAGPVGAAAAVRSAV